MQKEQIRNSIIAVITIFLIGGGAWYLSKKLYVTTLTGKENVIVEEDDGEENTEIEGQTIITSTTDSTKAQTVVTNNNEKFNIVMNNARSAFLVKNYSKSLSYYSEALGLQKRDVVYTGMYTVYLAQENWMKALEMLNKAIELAPVYPDYWSWKIELLDQKTNTSYEDLKLIYEEGLSKVDQKTKVNLVTRFAMVAEINDEKTDAISFWEYAKTLFPANNKIYQSEIDRLSKK